MMTAFGGIPPIRAAPSAFIPLVPPQAFRSMIPASPSSSGPAAPSAPPGEATGASAAARYWAANLDPQNLERESGAPAGLSLEDEIFFAWTPDVAAALDWLSPGGRRPSRIADLGAGLGAVSFAFARRGARMICIDTSPERLGELMRRAREAGCERSIVPLVAAAEALPFRDGCLPALFTKSVLIHTDLPRAAAGIARALAPSGRAALVEPQPGNPFAWLYRRTLAPRAWREITRYFSAGDQRLLLDRIGGTNVRPFYLFGFLAFAFQYAWPRRGLFSAALRTAGALDSVLLTLLPPLRRLAWFGVICADRAAAPESHRGAAAGDPE